MSTTGPSPDPGVGRRNYRIGHTAVAALAARLVSLAVSLASVPLVLHAVGSERFGLWTTVTSTLALLNLADLGIGNSLLNAVARSRATERSADVAKLVSSATFIFVAVAGLLSVVLVVLTLIVNWAGVFEVSGTTATHEAAKTVFVVGAALIISLPLGVTTKIQLAYQEGYRTQLWMIGGQLTALGALLVALHGKPSLPVLAGCLALVPVASQLGNTIRCFGFEHTDLRPRTAQFDRRESLSLLSSGAFFLFLQVSWILAFASDNLIIDRILGAGAVTGYAVPYRAFTAMATLAVIPLSALWPAYSDAYARHDVDWLRRTFVRTLVAMTAVGVLIGAVSLGVAQPVLHAWVGSRATFSQPLLRGFALWVPIYCVGSALSSYLNALGIVRFQTITVGLMVAANVPLSIVLVRAWGVSGAIYGSVISYLIFVLAPCAYYLPRHLHNLSSEPREALDPATATSQTSSSFLP